MAAVLKVVKRNGSIQEFNHEKITEAMWKAFEANGAISRQECERLSEIVRKKLEDEDIESPSVEHVQDVVEKILMENNYFGIAKAYIIYREKRAEVRERKKQKVLRDSLKGKLTIAKRGGKKEQFDMEKLVRTIKRASKGFEKEIDAELLANETVKNIFDGATTADIEKALVFSSTSFIEKDPAYDYVSARFFLQRIYKEAMKKSVTKEG